VGTICFISTLSSAPWGGSEELWCAVAARLAGQGTPVVAVTTRWPTRPAPLVALADAGVTVRSLRPAGLARRALYKTGLSRGPGAAGVSVLVVSMASAHDLIQAPAARAAVRHAARSGTPYVLAPHSIIERRLAPHNRALLRQLYTGSASIVLPSARLRRDLERQLAVALPQCVEIPTPTPLLSLAPAPQPAPDGHLRLACVGRLDAEQKGHDILLAALSRVSWNDDSWSLDLFGSGPDEAHLRDLVAHYGLAGHVRFQGHTRDVAAVWRDHDLLVLPSRREARGIVIAEAMACGRPTVATAVGGIPDSVVDGVTGLLAAAATEDAWVAALERLWRERARIPEWGANARRHVSALFSDDPTERFATLLLGLGSPGTALPRKPGPGLAD